MQATRPGRLRCSPAGHVGDTPRAGQASGSLAAFSEGQPWFLHAVGAGSRKRSLSASRCPCRKALGLLGGGGAGRLAAGGRGWRLSRAPRSPSGNPHSRGPWRGADACDFSGPGRDDGRPLQPSSNVSPPVCRRRLQAAGKARPAPLPRAVGELALGPSRRPARAGMGRPCRGQGGM